MFWIRFKVRNFENKSKQSFYVLYQLSYQDTTCPGQGSNLRPRHYKWGNCFYRYENYYN